jgi:hypothetical protein
MDEQQPLNHLSVVTPRLKHKAEMPGNSWYSCSSPSVLESNDSLGLDILPRRWEVNAVIGEDGTELLDRGDGEDVNDEEEDDDDDGEEAGDDGRRAFHELPLVKMACKREGLDLFLTGRFVAAE